MAQWVVHLLIVHESCCAQGNAGESGFLSNSYIFAIDTFPEPSHTDRVLRYHKFAHDVKIIPKSRQQSHADLYNFNQIQWHLYIYTLQIKQSHNALQPTRY